MELIQWIKGEYKGIRWLYEISVLSKTSGEALRKRPPGASNSIAWLIWHTARTDDFIVNGIIKRAPQVLQEGWDQKLGVADLRIGTGFGDEEVAELTTAIDVNLLDEYWKAVAEQTYGWLEGVKPEDLDVVPDLAAIADSIPPAMSAGNSALQIWQGRNIGRIFGGAVINHGYIHVGEMNAIRGQLGGEGYW